ncbi:MAG: hypothetical protein IJW69_00400 [Clostridia bacterium]|nr:hypothetical protein [Clostridia bacterium]
MKKILALALSVLMILALVACGEPADTTTEAPESTTEAPETPNVPETPDNVIAPTVEEGTWGAAFWADFEAAVAANKGATADVIANAVYSATSGAAIGMGMVMPMEAGYFQGFSADVSGFKSAAVIAPMMSSALLVYVFELEEGANVRDFVSFLNDNADPAWMVCMTAETTTIGAIDNYALVAYAPTNMPGVVGEAEVVAPEFTEGSEVETLWNDFLAYMDVNASFALATDVADYLAGNEVLGTEAATEALGESFEAEGLKYAVEGYNNAAVIKAGETALYIIQIDLGMDAWADYYVGGNIAEGADAVWGAHGTTFVIMMGIEA